MYKSFVILKLVLIGSLFLTTNSFATEDENLELIPRERSNYRSPLKPSEIYERTQSVLEYYKAPTESTGQEELSYYNGIQSAANIQNLLKYFDVNGMFTKLFSISNSELKSFDDLDGKTKKNFSVSLKPSVQMRVKALATARAPLSGLKVAIDPGHMGDKNWDDMTGKYIHDGQGNYLSEGVMAMQTALLLQSELRALGAQVELTRAGMVPATNMKFEDLSVSKFAKSEILEHIFSPWFLKLLSTGTGTTLHKAFDKSSDRKKLWSNSAKYNYFILKEDLWARADKINTFNPDVVLIIHYDVLPGGGDGHGLNANSPNQTKVYVSGAYYDTEFGSKKARKQFATKLLNQNQWVESIQLGRNIADQFKSQMGLVFPKAAQGSIAVAPGIFARNLTLPRFLNAPAVAYLECLFYNRPQEFYAFTDTKHPMIINGVNYPYSDRLKQVVSSIKQGVLGYAQSL